MRRALKALFIILLFSLHGCFVGHGVMHTVRRGENLYRISLAYGVDLQELAEINDIQDPDSIKAGFKLFIPGARRVRRVPAAGRSTDARRARRERVVVDKGRFKWPLKGTVSSKFGVRNGRHHYGIDIRAPKGSAIRAAADGRVVYVSSYMRGYGKIIIIKHSGDFYTVYAHNRTNDVKRGQRVKAGEKIATVGNSGNASGYHLHFEVRQGKKKRNPLFFLP